MASRFLNSLVAGSLVLSSSIAAAQAGVTPLQPAADSGLGSRGESGLLDDDSDAVTAIIFGLIVFTIGVWIHRGDNNNDDDNFKGVSP